MTEEHLEYVFEHEEHGEIHAMVIAKRWEELHPYGDGFAPEQMAEVTVDLAYVGGKPYTEKELSTLNSELLNWIYKQVEDER